MYERSAINIFNDTLNETLWSTKDKMKEKIRILMDKHPFMANVAASVVATVFIAIFQFIFFIPQAVSKAVNSDEYIEKVRNAVYSTNINNISNSSTGNNSSNDNTAGINLYLYGNVILDSNSVSDELDNSLNDVLSVEDNDISVSQTALSDDEVIACDINGKEYRASELVGKNIVLEYYDKNDDKNVYFQGMYNEKFHWDGECVTNSYYKDGRFFGACEYTFDDGIRKNYKSIVATAETQWSYADKVCTDNGNEGVNIIYSGETNVSIDGLSEGSMSVIAVDTIYDNLMPYIRVSSYYKGITVDGVYDDKTGEAYLIQFDLGGNVTLLYQGPFSKGTMHTANSEYTGWEIVYSEQYANYYCNEGKFINGFAENHSSNAMSIEEIEQYIEDKGIEPRLNLVWKTT